MRLRFRGLGLGLRVQQRVRSVVFGVLEKHTILNQLGEELHLFSYQACIRILQVLLNFGFNFVEFWDTGSLMCSRKKRLFY